MSYATLAEFKGWIDIDDTIEDTEIQQKLDATSRTIDRMCGRRFAVETAATKTFWASDPNNLQVPDLISLTSLAVDVNGNGTYSRTLTTANYELLPYMDETGAAAVRYDRIRILPTSSIGFYPGHRVRAIGNWGYVVGASNAAPDDVKLACLILTARLWKRRETPLGILGQTDLGTFERIRSEDPDVSMLLKPYVRGEQWVAV